MKKIGSLLLIGLISLIVMTGCSKEEQIEGKLTNLMDKVYEGLKEDDLPMYLENMEINEENVTSFIGTDKVKYSDILARESMVGSTAHSVVLIRTDKNQDIEEAKKEILDKVNPRKWVCVGVEKEDVIIKNKGNLILLVIVDDKDVRNKISENFDKLK